MRGCVLTVGQWHAAAERAMCHRPAKEIKKKKGGGGVLLKNELLKCGEWGVLNIIIVESS